MKVIVDHNLCEGNGRCVDVAPQVFELRDDDLSYVLVEHPPQTLHEKIKLAVRVCPRQAIRLVDE